MVRTELQSLLDNLSTLCTRLRNSVCVRLIKLKHRLCGNHVPYIGPSIHEPLRFSVHIVITARSRPSLSPSIHEPVRFYVHTVITIWSRPSLSPSIHKPVRFDVPIVITTWSRPSLSPSIHEPVRFDVHIVITTWSRPQRCPLLVTWQLSNVLDVSRDQFECSRRVTWPIRMF